MMNEPEALKKWHFNLAKSMSCVAQLVDVGERDVGRGVEMGCIVVSGKEIQSLRR